MQQAWEQFSHPAAGGAPQGEVLLGLVEQENLGSIPALLISFLFLF